MKSIKKNLVQTKRSVEKNGVTKLIAVSKFHSKEKITIAIESGQRLFGENRVQEALLKWPSIKEQFKDIDLHLIGPLQTNKIKDAFEIFDVIETVDRKKLADGIKRYMEKSGKSVDIFIQVNTGAEIQKSGVLPDKANDFIKYCKDLNLPVIGLMCIPPANEDPEHHFNILANIAKSNGLKNLSMGMSSDYKQAIKCGATHVRIGTAIFGKREN